MTITITNYNNNNSNNNNNNNDNNSNINNNIFCRFIKTAAAPITLSPLLHLATVTLC